MSIRRIGRECAAQFLYQHDSCRLQATELEAALENFWPLRELAAPAKEFANELIRGVLLHLGEVDAKIKSCADNWDFDRIAKVDLSVLRLGVFEMIFRDDIPPVVTINEAIEIAKRFSTEESGRFVNGILDRVRKDTLRPARQSAAL
jgi:transcription antitermination protein NusB